MVIKTLLALSLLCAAGADSVKLARSFPESQTKIYVVTADNQERDLHFVGELTFKVSGKAKDDLTPVKVTCPSAKMSSAGNVVEDEAIDVALNYDAHGMAVDLQIDGALMAVAVANASSYLPGSEVEVGKDFEIKYEKGGLALIGKGTLLKVEEKEGKKIASVKLAVDFTPTTGDNHGKLDVTTEFDLSDGSSLGSKGKLSMGDDGAFEFTIKPKAQ